MSGINKVILVGNIGKDPEVRYTPSNDAVVNATLATSETWKDKNTGQKQEKTEWHRITIFGGLAKIAAEYVHKGSKVYIEGKLVTRKWQDKNGQDRYTTEVVVDGFSGTLQMLDSKGSGGQDQNQNNQQQNNQNQQGSQQQNNQQQNNQNNQQGNQGNQQGNQQNNQNNQQRQGNRNQSQNNQQQNQNRNYQQQNNQQQDDEFSDDIPF